MDLGAQKARFVATQTLFVVHDRVGFVALWVGSGQLLALLNSGYLVQERPTGGVRCRPTNEVGVASFGRIRMSMTVASRGASSLDPITATRSPIAAFMCSPFS